MVPTENQIDEMLKLVVARLGRLANSHPIHGYNQNLTKSYIHLWMNKPMVTFHNCTPMQYIYLGLGQLVLNRIDDLQEQGKFS